MMAADLDLRLAGVARVRLRHLRKGEYLALEGDPSSYLFRVRSGGLILLTEHEDGSYAASDWIGPDRLYGLEDVVCNMPYRCSSRATARTVVECLPAEDLRQMMRTQPAVALAVATYLSDRVRFFSHHTDVLARGRLSERIRETLRSLAEREIDDGRSPALQFSQGDLAALVGASRQRVNPILTALRRAGLIECRAGGIRILSASAL